MKRNLRLLVVLLALLAGRPASACNVPVFRYALEKWRTDRFHLVVYHRGEWSVAAKALLKELNDKLEADGAAVNCDLTVIDLAKSGDEPERTWLKNNRDIIEPVLLVRTPHSAQFTANLWIGPFTREAVAAVLESPARRELLRRIRQGESGIFVLLESGDKSKDDAVVRLLEGQLARLMPDRAWPLAAADLTRLFAGNGNPLPAAAVLYPERTGPLQFPATYDPAGRSGPPLRIAFSVLRVKRDDPTERLLVQSLLHSEEDLAECPEPMAFPVFGRGRAMLALMGRGIHADNVREYGNYLVGACQCEVKAQNPGFELLMTADWDAVVEGPPVADRTPSTTEIRVGEPVALPPPRPTPASKATAPGNTGDAEDNSEPRPWLIFAAAGAGLLVLLTGIWAVRSSRNQIV